MLNKYHLIVSCPDQRGIVAAVSQFIADHQGLIIEADQHTDLETHTFFMRYEIDASSLQLDEKQFTQQFAPIAKQFAMSFHITDTNYRKRVLVLASKDAHCLEEILFRWNTNNLCCDIVGVASNHDALEKRTAFYDIPFHHLPMGDNKQPHFDALLKIIEEQSVDLVVLARYMQILPPSLCKQMKGKMINIHHSFLPSFIGANPYKQAYARGVKLIGATSHYVTAKLDEGPIIEQDTVRITHRQTLDDYINMGKDVEKIVLAKAVKAHLEDRVIIHGTKTVVF